VPSSFGGPIKLTPECDTGPTIASSFAGLGWTFLDNSSPPLATEVPSFSFSFPFLLFCNISASWFVLADHTMLDLIMVPFEHEGLCRCHALDETFQGTWFSRDLPPYLARIRNAEENGAPLALREDSYE